MKNEKLNALISANTFLGVEFGSTRIKAVLTTDNGVVIAQGSYNWENKYENGYYTYDLQQALTGLADCYKQISDTVKNQYSHTITKISSIGFSAMMHGYLAFDKDDNLLVPFRTWRNTTTQPACDILIEKLNFNIPQRWSVAHLYQAILNKEPHLSKISYITTLAGYIHWKVTGEKVLGVNDASGMFPIDEKTKTYNQNMINAFDKLCSGTDFKQSISDVLPQVKLAGETAGVLTEQGAKLIDPSGNLKSGIILCPPEGDAGTGMVATQSIGKTTGNVSAGTSIFAMVVLEKPLSNVYKEIDIVTTPSADNVAMVHCNSCTSDIDAWAKIFYQFATEAKLDVDMDKVYSTLYNIAAKGEDDCGDLVSVNCLSGEPVIGLDKAFPLMARNINSNFNLQNFMRMHLYSSMASLKIGMDLLIKQEKINISQIMAHGGLFKTKGVAQNILASALGVSVAVGETASEGGPWGMAVLAEYMYNKKQNQTLDDYLKNNIFSQAKFNIAKPKLEQEQGFNKFLQNYKKLITIEKELSETFGS